VDSHGNEIGLEELARALGFQTSCLDRADTDLFKRGAYRLGICRVVGCGLCAKGDRAYDRTTTCIERRECNSMIVARPAVEIVPPDRLQRSIRNAQRAGAGIEYW
jgi:hypothetical protein